MLKYIFFLGIVASAFSGCGDSADASRARTKKPERQSSDSPRVPRPLSTAMKILADAEALSGNEINGDLWENLVEDLKNFATTPKKTEEVLNTSYKNSYFANIIFKHFSTIEAKYKGIDLSEISGDLLNEIRRLLDMLPTSLATTILNRIVDGQSVISRALSTHQHKQFLQYISKYQWDFSSLDNERLSQYFVLFGDKTEGAAKINDVYKTLATSAKLNDYVLWSVGRPGLGFSYFYKNLVPLRQKEIRKTWFKEALARAKAAALASKADGSEVGGLAAVEILSSFGRHLKDARLADLLTNDVNRDVNLLTFTIDLLKGPQFADPRIRALVANFIEESRVLIRRVDWRVLAAEALTIASGTMGLNNPSDARALLQWDKTTVLD